jgi:hypothetical protein
MSSPLLARLVHLGVSIEREGSRLLLDGPEDVLTEALVAEVAAAKPSLLAVLGAVAPIGEAAETVVSGSGDVGPDSSAAKDDRRTGPDDGALEPTPWRCRCCGSGERRRRERWGDWVCVFCHVIVARPAETEQRWQMSRRDGPFPGDSPPAVTWGRERGYLAVRDPHTGDWHEIPYREAPSVWQAAVRRNRAPSTPVGRGSSDRHT